MTDIPFPDRSDERQTPACPSEEVFRAVVENTPDLVARFDRELRRRYVNPAIERLTGQPAEALLGRTLSELNFHPEFSSPIEVALSEVFATGTERTLEVLLPGPDGERVFQARIVPEQGPDGRAEFALVISRDITSIRRGEERLRTLTNEIELLLASTYEGICAVDLAGRCTLVNASAGSMLGHSPEEMLGQVLHDFVHARKDRGQRCGADDCGLLSVAADGTPVHVTHEVFQRKDGSSFPVEIFISPIVGSDGEIKGTVASFIDVTQRENLRAELERANRMAGLGRIAAAMSHEFNNVLMGIQPFAEVLLRASDEPRVVDAARRIIRSVARGRAITGDLRAFASPAPPVRTTVDVRSWLGARSAELRSLLPPSIQFDVLTHGPLMAMAIDNDQVMQVLRNLVQNAREAVGNSGSIRLEARLVCDRSRLQTDEPFVVLSLSDDGPGIGTATPARIIEPFFTTKEAGQGLGLAIAQQIVSLHGGRLFIESGRGTGTTVHVYLPAITTPALDEIDFATPESRRRLPSEILFVEDDEAVASGVTLLLEDEQVQVRLATTAAAALELIESWTPQALLIDINLPDGNGFDLYEQITASIGALPVVFASGHADPSRLAAVRTSAPVRLLTKPYAIDTLLETLENVVGAQ